MIKADVVIQTTPCGALNGEAGIFHGSNFVTPVELPGAVGGHGISSKNCPISSVRDVARGRCWFLTVVCVGVF
jgi:hypothetical protein